MTPGPDTKTRSRRPDPEAVIRARMEAGQASDPVFGLPSLPFGPVLALLSVHPLAWLACWAGLLGVEPGASLPLLSASAGSLMLGSLFFALALLAQCLLLLPPVLLVLAGVFWAWVLLALGGTMSWPPLP